MTDSDLLKAAIDVTGFSEFRFANEVLDVDQRIIERWLEGERRVPFAVRVVCLAILERPELVEEIVRARNGSGD